MPITPLHAGVLAPINHFFPKKVSSVSFILVSLWLDIEAILYVIFEVSGRELHGPVTHSFAGSLAVALIVAIFGFMSLRWVLGALLGAVSHVLLDMLVHAEMQRLAPWRTDNPFYLDGMVIVSALLVVPTAWFVLQLVSGTGGCVPKMLGRLLQRD